MRALVGALVVTFFALAAAYALMTLFFRWRMRVGDEVEKIVAKNARDIWLGISVVCNAVGAALLVCGLLGGML